MKHLTIKPTHKCVQSCSYCISRQQLLRSSSENMLTLTEWKRIFNEAKELGVEYLDISGGEPILYKYLVDLIKEAKKMDWFVSLNSTGYEITRHSNKLTEALLDQIIISIVSISEEKHDQIRGKKGSYKTATRAIEHLNKMPVRVVLHLILNKYNYYELPDIIDFAFANNINSLALVYPENDWENKHLLLNESEIGHFRNDILPACLSRYSFYRSEKSTSHMNIAGLYSKHGVLCDFSSGIFWQDLQTAQNACHKAEKFALIYPNGNVYPCNGVEYNHIQAMGNTKSQSLLKIWNGSSYEQFRKTKTDFCIKCPVVHHTGIAIKTTYNPPYMIENRTTDN